MHGFTTSALLPLFVLFSLTLADGERPGETLSDSPVSAERWVEPSSCGSLHASSLEGYRNLIGKALSAARADAKANGTTGQYAVAATNARDLLQRAHDRATQMVDFNNTQGNKDPRVTTYVEGGVFKTHLQTILKWLPDAAHWATISATYHKSTLAADAFDRTAEAMNRGSQLMGEAGRCFMSGWL